MFQGQARHSRRLANLAAKAEEITKSLYAASDIIRVEARRSITAGSVSGRSHVPSQPGEPPNADTHHLDQNITNEVTGPLTVEVRSHAKYSVALEFGTSKMAERPFMRPAVKKVQSKFKNLFSADVKKMVRES